MNLHAKLMMLKGVLTKRSPIYVQFAVSKFCNLNCQMCQAVQVRKDERELSLGEIEKLAQVLYKIGAGIVILTGGEPLLRKDIAEIVGIFSQRGFDVRIQTNGLLASEEKISQLLKAGLNEITLSLDTLEPETQDKINNQSGSWERIIRALALFSRLLPKRGNMTGVNTVVSRLNIEEIPKIVKFVSAIGFYSSLIPVHLSSDSKTDFIVRRQAENFRFRERDFDLIDKVYQRVIDMKKNGYQIINSYKFLRNSPKFLKYGKVQWSCDSPDLYFSISPQGIFLPCVDLKGEKSMLDDDFLDVFNSQSFRDQIRRKVKSCAGCFYACYPEVSYFCRDIKTFCERILEGTKISLRQRKPVSYEESLRLIQDFRKES